MIKLVVGLGNPGVEYELTRHNIGFMAVDYWAKKYGADWKNHKKSNTLIAEITIAEERIKTILTKPQTFMNNSGRTAVKLLSFYNLLPKKMGLFKKEKANLSQILFVIHDDLDLPLGQFKISINRGSGGHRGVQSIINQLKTKNFGRLRIGINAPEKEKIGGEKFVMGKIKNEEMEKVNETIKKATMSLKQLLTTQITV